jgi:replicative DNA helicase
VSAAGLTHHNQAAEEDLLSSLLRSTEAVEAVIDELHAGDFYLPKHRAIYSAVVTAYDREGTVSPIIVTHELEQTGKLNAAGGQKQIDELLTYNGNYQQAPALTKIIRQHAGIRAAAVAGDALTNLSAKGVAANLDPDQMLEQAERLMSEAYESRGANEFISITDLISDEIHEINQNTKDGTERAGTPTGIHDFDHAYRGLWPGQLVVVAGITGEGKSALAVQVSHHVAKQDLGVLYFTLEMPREDVVRRILSREAKIDYRALLMGMLDTDQAFRLTLTGAEIASKAKSQMVIRDHGPFTLTAIKTAIRRYQRQLNSRGSKLGLVVIDHIGLIPAGDDLTKTGSENRNLQIATITRELKTLAMELGTPILALSQFNRDHAKRASKRPVLSDLRDSGAIEQDADIVAFIHREATHNPDTLDHGAVELIIAKARNGEPQTINLHWVGKHMTFRNHEPAPTLTDVSSSEAVA